MKLGLLFGLPPPPIFVVPGCTAVTSGLAWAWRVLAFPALGWPARRDVLRQGHGLRHFPGFLSLGARLDAVDPAREPVPFGAPVTPSLSFDSRLAAVSAEAAGLGFGEFLLVIGPLSFFSGLGRQRDSLLFAFLRCCLFSGSFLFGIVCSRARLFLLASSLGAMVSINEKLSFRMVYPGPVCAHRAPVLKSDPRPCGAVCRPPLGGCSAPVDPRRAGQSGGKASACPCTLADPRGAGLVWFSYPSRRAAERGTAPAASPQGCIGDVLREWGSRRAYPPESQDPGDSRHAGEVVPFPVLLHMYGSRVPLSKSVPKIS